MKTWRLLSSAWLILTAAACGEHFDEDCQPGTVMQGTRCVAFEAGGAAGGSATAGAAGASAGNGGAAGVAGYAGKAGAGATAGDSSAGAAGSTGAAGAGGSKAGGGGAAGAGTAGGGAAGAGASGAGAAAGGGGMGAQGGVGVGGTAGGTAAGAAGAAGASAGNAGSTSAGSTSAGGTGGSTSGGASGAGGAGAGPGGSGAGGAGAAGAGGACDVSACPADECHVPVCDGSSCAQAFADPGVTCGTSGVCNGAGLCGVCKPGDAGCDGKIPKTCGPDGQWKSGDSCDFACKADGACALPVELAAGTLHTCVLLDDGTIWCWGSNQGGQLGADPTVVVHGGPLPVGAAPGATRIASGATFSCVRATDGVRCWGTTPGQAKVLTPTLVTGTAGAIDVYANGDSVCARFATGSILCWGAVMGATLPTSISVPGGAEEVSIGAAHLLVRTPSGELYCMGKNDKGQCGLGNTVSPVNVPTKVATGGYAVTSIAAGSSHSCALLKGNGTHCWGLNDRGQLGRGVPIGGVFPVPFYTKVPELASTVRAYSDHTCAVRSTGAPSVDCWGANEVGQCGRPPLVSYPGPEIPVPANTTYQGPYGATSLVAPGGLHTCAMFAGRIWCWGQASEGQLGEAMIGTAWTEVPTLLTIP